MVGEPKRWITVPDGPQSVRAFLDEATEERIRTIVREELFALRVERVALSPRADETYEMWRRRTASLTSEGERDA